MATSPDVVRRDLRVITDAAQADIRAVANATPEDPATLRAALFAATPLIVTEYAEGAAALALDWFEELREESGVATPFRPVPFVTVTDDEIAAIVAQTTKSLYDLQRGIEQEIEETFAEMLAELEDAMVQEVQDGFRDTIVENSKADPESGGWKRFAQPGACKFCVMLAARGAVYTRETARFAAHGAVTNGKRTGGDCRCIAGPEFGGQETWAEATPMQYVASKRQRTEAERKALRAYLNKNFPDAPG